MPISRRSIWISGVPALALLLCTQALGCGSDEESATLPPGTTDGGDASDVSLEGSGGSGGTTGEGGPKCTLNGMSCTANLDCCSANCDAQTKTCSNPPGQCKPPGEACLGGTECCSVICSAGLCGSGVCLSDGKPCTANEACCSGKCGQTPEGGAAVCTPLNPGCRTAGNDCSGNSDCCSKFCVNGRCSSQPSFCTQTGDACLTDFECCTGICTKQSGDALGLCVEPTAPGSTGCLAAGVVCSEGAVSDAGGIPACGGSCCSRSCAPYGPTGVLVCQPPSGCRPTGEICREDADCCGAAGSLDGEKSKVQCSKSSSEPVGRCDNGNACRAAGAVCKLATGSCNAENNCCAGNVNKDPLVCQQDLLGIPRCTAVGDCADAGSKEGQPCASSADCCGLSCVPSKVGGAPFVCGGNQCVAAGGDCTTDADCCAGLPCVASPGSTHGLCGSLQTDAGVPESGIPEAAAPDAPVVDAPPSCALYGQSCTTAADCCNAVPCTLGRCVFPVY